MFMTRMSWILVLVAFMAVGWIAERLAQSDAGPGAQYFGLALYIVAEAVIFLPLLYFAQHFYPGAITTAGILTLAIFGGLTMTVFITRQDFSFLRPILCIGSWLALGLIVAAVVMGGFTLGLFFCFAMVALISGYILYYTSNVLHYYRTDRHVAASLALFASIATLFWYILQIVMMSQRD
jgi:FtsH-binding integral membrane protein